MAPRLLRSGWQKQRAYRPRISAVDVTALAAVTSTATTEILSAEGRKSRSEVRCGVGLGKPVP